MRFFFVSSVACLIGAATAGDWPQLQQQQQQQQFDVLEQDSPNFPVCYVCGSKSRVITKPEQQVSFPGQDPISCDRLEYGGLNGFINPSYCPMLAMFKVSKLCGCVEQDNVNLRDARKMQQDDDDDDMVREGEKAADNNEADGFVVDYAVEGEGAKDMPLAYNSSQQVGDDDDGENEVDDMKESSTQVKEKAAVVVATGQGYEGNVTPSTAEDFNSGDGEDEDEDTPSSSSTSLRAHQQKSSHEATGPSTSQEESEQDELSQDDEGDEEERTEEDGTEGNTENNNTAPAPSPGFPTCYVCGSKDMVVTNRDATIAFPGVDKPVPCYKLEYGGLNGFISPSQCSMLAFFRVKQKCGCAAAPSAGEDDEGDEEDDHGEEKGEKDSTVSKETTASESLTQVKTSILGTNETASVEEEESDNVEQSHDHYPATEAEKDEGRVDEADAPSGTQSQEAVHLHGESPEYPVCHVCWSDKLAVTRPDVKVNIPGQDRSVRCSKLELGGLNGYISPQLCSDLVTEQVPEICGCEPIAWHVTTMAEENYRDEAESEDADVTESDEAEEDEGN